MCFIDSPLMDTAQSESKLTANTLLPKRYPGLRPTLPDLSLTLFDPLRSPSPSSSKCKLFLRQLLPSKTSSLALRDIPSTGGLVLESLIAPPGTVPLPRVIGSASAKVETVSPPDMLPRRAPELSILAFSGGR